MLQTALEVFVMLGLCRNKNNLLEHLGFCANDKPSVGP